MISPLLLNIALHGMEEALEVKCSKRGNLIGKRALVRYADDFAIFCESKEDAQAAKQTLSQWLAKRGLVLSEEKTRIVHLSKGFDFLGFNIRHYSKPKTTKTGWKLLTKPSKQSVQKLRSRLKGEWLALSGQNVQTILARLNPIIRGWANYFRVGVAAQTFNELDSWMYWRCVRYVKRTHPSKSTKWQRRHYWGRLNLARQDKFVFGNTKTGRHLLKFSWFPIEYPIMVSGRSSPDDPQLKEYWHKRKAKESRNLSESRQKIATNQKGRCPVCQETLFNGEELQVHHVVPRSQGGKDTYNNLRLLHLFCHQHVHAQSPELKRDKQEAQPMG